MTEGDAKPPVSRLTVAVITLVTTGLAMAVRITYVQPMKPLIAPAGWDALPFAVIFGFGVGVILALARANRDRWSTVMRSSRGKVIGAVILAAVTPVVIDGWVPSIVGAWALVLGVMGVVALNLQIIGIWLVSAAVLAAVWYPVSCLIVSGLQSRPLRVAVYCLMFWAAYSAVILMMGTQRFML